MARNRKAQQARAAGRFGRIIAGAGLVASAMSWLIVNEQGRQVRLAVRDAIMRASPTSRARLGRFWRWWQITWTDPWGANRAELVSSAAGDVLEVGVGRWPNLRRYRLAQTLVGVEPKRRGVMQVRRRIRRFHPDAKIFYAPDDRLPFRDASFDTVVASLALCSVRDPAATMREIARVLRPDGTLRFLEHVRSPNRFLAGLQAFFTPLWRVMADDCHLNRDTLQAIRAAGFTIDTVALIRAGWPLSRPTYLGVARPPTAPPSITSEDL
jgi:SAM-dependent methyltransferase